jgi:hypothetical protein
LFQYRIACTLSSHTDILFPRQYSPSSAHFSSTPLHTTASPHFRGTQAHLTFDDLLTLALLPHSHSSPFNPLSISILPVEFSAGKSLSSHVAHGFRHLHLQRSSQPRPSCSWHPMVLPAVKSDIMTEADEQPSKRRRRSRRAPSDRKFECTHEGCGKSYSRAEHLYRHQLNRMRSSRA